MTPNEVLLCRTELAYKLVAGANLESRPFSDHLIAVRYRTPAEAKATLDILWALVAVGLENDPGPADAVSYETNQLPNRRIVQQLTKAAEGGVWPPQV